MPVTLDQFVIGALEGYVRTHVQPKVPQFDLLGNGLGVVIRGLVQSAGIPDVTGDEIAAGALKAIGIGAGARPGALYRPVRRVSIDKGGPGRVIDVRAEVVP